MIVMRFENVAWGLDAHPAGMTFNAQDGDSQIILQIPIDTPNILKLCQQAAAFLPEADRKELTKSLSGGIVLPSNADVRQANGQP